MASGIEKRHTVIADYGRPMEERTFFPRTRDFRPEPTTQARNDLFIARPRRSPCKPARHLRHPIGEVGSPIF